MKCWLKCSEAMRLLKKSRPAIENGGFETKAVGKGMRYLIDVPEPLAAMYATKSVEAIEREEAEALALEEDEIEKALKGNDLDDLDEAYLKARMENTKTRTQFLKERLIENKKAIWIELNDKVYEAFTDAFAKWKNSLVLLHLNAEQLQTLYDGMEEALKSLGDKLDIIGKELEKEEEEGGQNEVQS